MNDQDLRVIKTNESIENALFELLRSKPLEKITVTELARAARINKGTFYLHYATVPDLYQKTMLKTLLGPIGQADYFSYFFDAPERFLTELGQSFVQNFPQVQTLLQGSSELPFMDRIVESLRSKVYETGRIAQSTGTDMKLDTINIPALLWGLGMSNVSLKCGFCPGGARRIERLIRMIQAGRIHPGKLLNYKFEGFDKIEDAFKLMDSKPKDLIKPYVLI